MSFVKLSYSQLTLAACVLLLAGSSSCLRVAHAVHHVRADSMYGGLTLTIDWEDSVYVCAFSNDRFPNGGEITYKSTYYWRDGYPVRVYYVAPDSIFILNDGWYNKCLSSKSKGINIVTIDRIQEHDTVPVHWEEDGVEKTSYILMKSTDSLLITYPNGVKLTRVYPDSLPKSIGDLLIDHYTYYIKIYNSEIYIWDSDGKELTNH